MLFRLFRHDQLLDGRVTDFAGGLNLQYQPPGARWVPDCRSEITECCAAISRAANLLGCDLDGNVQRITYDVVDKEPAELEAFADAVANGVKFVIAPEAIAAASRGGKGVTIR
jgi:hypothetical protein